MTEWGELLPHKNTNTDRRTKGVDLGGLDLSFTSTLASIRFSVGVLDECFDAEMDETLDGHERIWHLFTTLCVVFLFFINTHLHH